MNMILRLSITIFAASTVLGLAAASAQAAAPAEDARTGGGLAPVPANFRPAAASFSSPSSGVALGGAGCQAGKPCRARLAATSNRGASWRSLPAPRAWLANGRAQVNEVVFASQRNGWLYNRFGSPSVWATHNGGGRWTRLSLPGDVQTMAASAGTVYAVVSRPAGDELYRSPAGSNRWARVGTLTAASASLAVLGRAAWFGSSPYLWATTDGTHWHRYSFRCPSGLVPSGIAPSSTTHVAFLCALAEGTFHTRKTVLQSVNGGRTEHVAGRAPLAGDVVGFAGPPLRSRVVTIAVVTPGLDDVYRSADGGRAWASIPIAGTGGGAGLNSFQFASPAVGWLVVGVPQAPGWLLRTTNAGQSWSPVTF
jgi:photosystem II stability/assembly factor-like uncharacterized protein